jgi:hypothetical protein
MADPIQTSDITAPEENVASWNYLWVDGRQCPGQCLPIDFERERECDQPKKKGSSVNKLFDQGLKPSEVTVRIRTTTGDQLRELQSFYAKYMDPERPLARLSVVTVAQPQLYARGVKTGYFFKAGSPMPTREGGVWPLISTFAFKIVDPKTKITTASGSSKPKVKDAYANVPVSNLLLGSVAPVPTPGVSATQQPRPADQKGKVLDPSDLRKSASSGNGLAKMIVDSANGRAPQ